MKYALAALLTFGALPVLGQDLEWYAYATEKCLSHTRNLEACIGASASACMEQEGGSSTYGMRFCLGQEVDYWDERLNKAYGERRTEAKNYEQEHSDLSVDLKLMQRTWIAFRDAKCTYAANQFYGGTFAPVAYSQCLLEETARQTLLLEISLEQ